MTTASPMETIKVTISMEDHIKIHTTDKWSVSVSKGATLFMAMQTLEKRDPTFSFESKPTEYGPMIITINHIKADDSSVYWEILKAPNNPTKKGVAEIILEAGDHYIFRLTKINDN